MARASGHLPGHTDAGTLQGPWGQGPDFFPETDSFFFLKTEMFVCFVFLNHETKKNLLSQVPVLSSRQPLVRVGLRIWSQYGGGLGMMGLEGPLQLGRVLWAGRVPWIHGP